MEQHHWLQFNGSTWPEVQCPHSRLFQGDPLSPLGLNLLLSRPLRDLRRRMPELAVCSYLDDRNMVTRSIGQVKHATDHWASWCRHLGLLENEEKLTLVCRQQKDKKALEDLGFQSTQFADSARVLGVDLRITQAHRHTAEKRRQAAERAAARLLRVSLSVKVKRRLWRTRAVPTAAWGHFLGLSSQRELRPLQAAKKRALREHKMGLPFFQRLLEGHSADIAFCAGCSAFSSLSRA